MLFVVRHGERADYAGADEMREIQTPLDPHLTDLGKIQARITGDHILKLLKEYHQGSSPKPEDLKYLIISSPFKRCIQTDNHIAQALPKEKIWGTKSTSITFYPSILILFISRKISCQIWK